MWLQKTQKCFLAEVSEELLAMPLISYHQAFTRPASLEIQLFRESLKGQSSHLSKSILARCVRVCVCVRPGGVELGLSAS